MADSAQESPWVWDSARRQYYYVHGDQQIYQSDQPGPGTSYSNYAVPASHADYNRQPRYACYYGQHKPIDSIYGTKVPPQHDSQHRPLGSQGYPVEGSTMPHSPSPPTSQSYHNPQAQPEPWQTSQYAPSYTHSTYDRPYLSQTVPANSGLPSIQYNTQGNDQDRQRDDRNDRNRHGRNGWRDSDGNGGQDPHDPGRNDDHRDSDDETQGARNYPIERYPGSRYGS